MPSNTESTGVKVNNQEVLRDSNGRFLKGTPAPNPTGRPKDSGFKDRLNELVGEDSRDIALILCEMAFYEQGKDRWPKYKPTEKLKALELILKYKEQLPIQKTEISTPEDRTVNIEFIKPGSNDDNK